MKDKQLVNIYSNLETRIDYFLTDLDIYWLSIMVYT